MSAFLDHTYYGMAYPIERGKVQWDRPESISGAFHRDVDRYVSAFGGRSVILDNGEGKRWLVADGEGELEKVVL